MDHNIAKKLVSNVLLLSNQLNEIILIIEEVNNEEEKKRFRKAIGTVVARLWVELLRPIFQEYAELDPTKSEEA